MCTLPICCLMTPGICQYTVSCDFMDTAVASTKFLKRIVVVLGFINYILVFASIPVNDIFTVKDNCQKCYNSYNCELYQMQSFFSFTTRIFLNVLICSFCFVVLGLCAGEANI